MPTDPNPGRRSAAPVHVVTCAPEYRSRPVAGRRGTSVRIGTGVWAAYHRRSGPKWSRPTAPTLMPAPSFWAWLGRIAAGGRRVWLVAPSASDLLTLSGFWPLVKSGAWRVIERPATDPGSAEAALRHGRCWVGSLVLGGYTDIVEARTTGGSLLAVSLSNYAERDWHRLSHSVGWQLPPVEAAGVSTALLEPSGYDQASILGLWFRSLVSTWVERSYGTFGKTAGQLSVSIWRTADGPRAARRHHNDEVRHLEAYACFGGRAVSNYHGLCAASGTDADRLALPRRARRYGVWETEACRWDVRSQYPQLLGSQIYPQQLCGVQYSPSLEETEATLKHWCVIASVRVCTTLPEYPVRTRGSTAYPAGSFDTCLAGPELAEGLRDGSIRRVYALARYKPGRPFVGWASTVLRERSEARQRGDGAAEVMWKGIANSFGGKFAQRSNRWVTRTDVVPPTDWGEWWEAGTEGSERTRFRSVAGVAFEACPGLPGHRLPAAVFAYLTSYGRLQMRLIRGLLGNRGWISQDTDGLWCPASAGERLTQSPGLVGDSPGLLRLADTVPYAWFITPRHYVAGGRWTLSGYCEGWTLEGVDRVRERRTVNPARLGARKVPRYVLETVKTVELPSLQHDGPVDQEGWWQPVVWGPRSAVLPQPVPLAPNILPGMD